jgi:hypothetical protein
MFAKIKCSLGFHDWRIANEVEVPGSGFTDDPGDFECGGVDYILACSCCPMARIIRKRGFWIPLPYPKADRGDIT